MKEYVSTLNGYSNKSFIKNISLNEISSEQRK
jgi:hypothetical protein